VTFVINCHEYNERWYTRLDGLNVRVIAPEGSDSKTGAEPSAGEAVPY